MRSFVEKETGREYAASELAETFITINQDWFDDNGRKTISEHLGQNVQVGYQYINRKDASLFLARWAETGDFQYSLINEDPAIVQKEIRNGNRSTI